MPIHYAFYLQTRHLNATKYSAYENPQRLKEEHVEIQTSIVSVGNNLPLQLARVYDDGKLVPRDFDKALHWYKKAAMNEYEEAQFTLGYFYCRGIGVKKNEAIANEWLIKSKRSDRCME